jgi:WD40 repeat protein
MYQASVDWEQQRVLGGFSDGSIFLLDFAEESAGPTKLIGRHGKCVTSLAVDWYTNRAFTASYDRTAILWDILAGQALRVFEGHKGVIMDVALSWSQKLAASGSADGTIALWSLAGEDEGQRLLSLRGHAGTVRALAINWSGQTILSASSDRNLGLWRFEYTYASSELFEEADEDEVENSQALASWTSSLVAMLQGHRDEVNIVSAKWSDDIAISASNDRTLRIWDLVDCASLHVLQISGCADITAMQVNWDGLERDMVKT